MKLSIITVNLNNRNGLQKTIDSVVSQTFRDFEWIVIDGGSTDGSKELIEQYTDHFAYWVSEPDKGVFNAMNKGIKVAKGDYLQFLNSGDWLYNQNALERCFSHIFDADVVYGDMGICSSNTIRIRKYSPKLSFNYLLGYSLGHCATFHKREILQEELYDEKLKMVADWKFYLIQALKNRKFEHLDETVSCFDTSGISSTSGYKVIAERDNVIKELMIPESILNDCRFMDEMEKELQLNQDRVRKVIEYSEKRKLYRKMITGCLRFIEFVERLTNQHG